MNQIQAENLGRALHQLHLLREKKIVEKGDDQARAAIENFCGTELMNNAQELVTCWFVVHRQYQPLVTALADIFSQAIGLIQAREQQQQQQQQQQAAQQPAPEPPKQEQEPANPSNVVPLPTK